jgi:hypothetical protein
MLISAESFPTELSNQIKLDKNETNFSLTSMLNLSSRTLRPSGLQTLQHQVATSASLLPGHSRIAEVLRETLRSLENQVLHLWTLGRKCLSAQFFKSLTFTSSPEQCW